MRTTIPVQALKFANICVTGVLCILSCIFLYSFNLIYFISCCLLLFLKGYRYPHGPPDEALLPPHETRVEGIHQGDEAEAVDHILHPQRSQVLRLCHPARPLHQCMTLSLSLSLSLPHLSLVPVLSLPHLSFVPVLFFILFFILLLPPQQY